MTAYELRISDWSSDVCSSDLVLRRRFQRIAGHSGFCLNGHRQERAYCGARLHLFPEASQRPYENSRQEPEVKASTDIDRKRAPNVGRSGAAFSFDDPWLLLANAVIGNWPRTFKPHCARHRRPRPRSEEHTSE